MPALTVPASPESLVVSTNPSSISINALIALYAVIPLAAIVYGLDQYTFGLVHMILPGRPEEWAFWIYIFGMPHVFASFFLLADKEYVAYFGKKLWVGAAVILALPWLLTALFGPWIMIVGFTAMIVYHTIAQQFGIALVIGKRRPDTLHKINTFVGSALGVVIYMFVYADTDPAIFYYTGFYKSTLLLLAWGMMASVVLMTAWQIIGTTERRGQIYMALNALMLVSMLLLYRSQLGLLVVIMGRIVHEFTAWFIYASHDKNRNHDEMRNLVYRHFAWLKISPYWIGMVLAFTFGIAFTYLSEANGRFLFYIIVSFSLYHYWMEGFIWKGNSPPKRHLRFK